MSEKQSQDDSVDHDSIERPAHYYLPGVVVNMAYGQDVAQSVEFRRIAEASGLVQSFYRASALKYILRAGRKGGPADEIRDLEKARRALEYEVERLRSR